MLILMLAAALFAGCNGELKEQLAQLQEQKSELEGATYGLPDAQQIVLPDLSIALDKCDCWVDARGSFEVHYTLNQPATLETEAGEGWSIVVENAQSGENEGTIKVTAPDPASPAIVRIKATTQNGSVAETFFQVFVRKPFCNTQSPRIESLGYNGLNGTLGTLENFQKLADAGMTMITVEGEDLIHGPWWRDQCRYAEQTGVKVVLFINYTAGLYSDDPVNYKGLDALIAEAKQYPAICAYQIADEPSTAIANRLATAKRRINELDPDRPVYINLHPSTVSTAGMGANSYEEYVEHFASVCDLEFITFDQYPVRLEGVENSWYHSLNVVRDAARRHGVPFWAFLLCSRLQGREDPTLENIRMQGNVNLAYGAQCNQFFVWKCLSDSDYAPIMGDGTYKPVYYDIQKYNHEVHSREFVFARGDVYKLRHIGHDYYLHGTYPETSDLPDAISGISTDGSAVVSFIRNSGNEYVVLCNKSWQEKISVYIGFTRAVYTIDREGEFSEQPPGETRFIIDEGDMLVIKWR